MDTPGVVFFFSFLLLFFFLALLAPSEKGSTQKGKKLLPGGATPYLFEQTPSQKGDKNNFDRTDFP